VPGDSWLQRDRKKSETEWGERSPPSGKDRILRRGHRIGQKGGNGPTSIVNRMSVRLGFGFGKGGGNYHHSVPPAKGGLSTAVGLMYTGEKEGLVLITNRAVPLVGIG